MATKVLLTHDSIPGLVNTVEIPSDTLIYLKSLLQIANDSSWVYDVAGWAIANCEDPGYAEASGIHDFHDIPLSAVMEGTPLIVGPVRARVIQEL